VFYWFFMKSYIYAYFFIPIFYFKVSTQCLQMTLYGMSLHLPPINRSAYAPDKCCEAKDTDAQTHGCPDTRAVWRGKTLRAPLTRVANSKGRSPGKRVPSWRRGHHSEQGCWDSRRSCSKNQIQNGCQARGVAQVAEHPMTVPEGKRWNRELEKGFKGMEGKMISERCRTLNCLYF